MRETTPQKILALPMEQPNDASAATVRDYLVELLYRVWNEEAEFSGKRPFGNSGWSYDLYRPLVRAGILDALLDPEDGELHGFTNDQRHRADRLISEAIYELGKLELR